MDEARRETFKRKFIVVTVLLNIVILSFAMAAFAFIRYWGSTEGLIAGAVLLVIGLISTFVFVRRYRSTKRWLDESAQKSSG
jgi:ACR3 family arsenite efflux pump ArsB